MDKRFPVLSVCRSDLRKNYHDQLTLSTLYAYSEHYILTLGSRDVGNLEEFMDEACQETEKQKLAQVREAYSYMMVHPGCKMNGTRGRICRTELQANACQGSECSFIQSSSCSLSVWMMIMTDLSGFS